MPVGIFFGLGMLLLGAMTAYGFSRRRPRNAHAEDFLHAPCLSARELEKLLSQYGLACKKVYRRGFRLSYAMPRRLLTLLASCPDTENAALLAAQEHARLIEKSALTARAEAKPVRRIPWVQGRPSIMIFCECLLRHSTGHMDKDRLRAAAYAWTEAVGLRECEVQLLPCVLRWEALRQLTMLLEGVAAAQRERLHGERLSARLLHGRTDVSLLFQHVSLTPALIAAFAQRLEKEQAVSALQEADECLTRHGMNLQKSMEQAQAQELLCLGRVTGLVALLKLLDLTPWEEELETLDPLHAILLEDPAKVYPRMTLASRRAYCERVAELARAMGTEEEETALAAIACAEEEEEEPRRHAGFYLLMPEGTTILAQRLHAHTFRFSLRLFLQKHGAGVAVGAACGLAVLAVWAWNAAKLPLLGIPLLLLSMRLPLLRLTSAAVKALTPRRIVPALRPDILEAQQKTLVVLPTILGGRKQALRLAAKLAAIYHADPSPQIDYMLLADFQDAVTETQMEDAEIVRAASKAVDSLSETYPARFLYFQRARTWSGGEHAYMGRGRLAGLCEALDAILSEGACDDRFAYIGTSFEALHRRYAYVVTLEEDAVLLPETIHRLIGTISHPLNVREDSEATQLGYGRITPRLHPDSFFPTRVGRLAAYLQQPTAVQRLLTHLYGHSDGQGVSIHMPHRDEHTPLFRGELTESLLDFAAFRAMSDGCGVTAEVQAMLPVPRAWSAVLASLHHQARSVWQALPLLFPTLKGTDGRTANPMPLDGRLLLGHALANTLSPLFQLGLTAFSIGCASPVLFLCALAFSLFSEGRFSLLPALMAFCSLPDRAVTLLDGMFRGLWRRFVSHEKLLASSDLTTQEHTEPFVLFITPWTQWIAALLFAGLSFLAWPMSAFGLLPALLFALWPLLVPRLDSPAASTPIPEDAQEQQWSAMAEETWSLFLELMGAETFHLPPAAFQIAPWRGMSPYACSADVGLYLLACFSAMSVGLMDADEASRKMAATVETLEKLPTFHGCFYEKYELSSLQPDPAGRVDAEACGLLAACLLCVGGGMRKRLQELDPTLRTLPARLDDQAYGMELSVLYDQEAGLFHEYAVPAAASFSEEHLTHFASPALLLSFVAVMTHQVPPSHMERLDRTQLQVGRSRALFSRFGDLAAYGIPLLLLPPPYGELLQRSLQAIVASSSADPWWCAAPCVHESYNAELWLQLKDFGYPAFSAVSQETPTVFAPYAAALVLPFLPDQASEQLQSLRSVGMVGRFGFYDGLDCTVTGNDADAPERVLKTQLLGHQALLLCGLCNAMTDGLLSRTFASLPQVRAFLPLLNNANPAVTLHAPPIPREREAKQAESALSSDGHPLRLPMDAVLLSSGNAWQAVSAQGLGVMCREGRCINRFSRDASLGEGLRFYVVEQGNVWQPADPLLSGYVRFTDSMAVFRREHAHLSVELTFSVAPATGCFVQEMTLVNLSDRPRLPEIADYFVPSLLPFAEQEGEALPLQYQPFGINGLCVSVSARPSHPPLRLYHAVYSKLASSIFITTQQTAFLGRNGQLGDPDSLHRSAETGFVQSPVAPCVSLRAAVPLNPDQRVKLTFVTLLLRDEQEITDDLLRMDREELNRSRALALLTAQTLRKSLGINQEDALLIRRMTGALLWLHQPHQGADSPLSADRRALQNVGISGALPLLLCTITAAPSALADFACHAVRLWAQQGFPVETVFLLTEKGDGPLHLQMEDLLGLSALHGNAHVTVLDYVRADRPLRELLRACAALSLDDRSGSVEEQLAHLECAVFAAAPVRVPPATLPSEPSPKLLFDSGIGGFLPDSGDFTLRLPAGVQTPTPWHFVAANPFFGTLLCESGLLGTFLAPAPFRCLTYGKDDQTTPRPAEFCFLRCSETNRVYSPTRLPLGRAQDCEATFGAGWGSFGAEADGLAMQLLVFTDAESPVGCRLLRVKNRTSQEQRLTLHVCARFLLSEDANDASMVCLSAPKQRITVTNPALSGIGFMTPFTETPAVSRILPAALFYGVGDGLAFATNDLPEEDYGHGEIGLLTAELRIPPRGTAEFGWLMGMARNADAVEEILAKWQAESVSEHLLKVRRAWAAALDLVTCHVPDEALALMLNRWLPYQVRTGRLMPPPSGAAERFSDRLLDTYALAFTDPTICRRVLLQHAARQYESGDVQTMLHSELTGLRVRNSVERLYLPLFTALYLAQTDDTSLLDVQAPFLTDVPLPEGVNSMEQSPVCTAYAAPLSEHCLRALRSVPHGAGGLPLEGMQESVYAAFLEAYALRLFARFVEPSLQAEMNAQYDRLMDAASIQGWRGTHYARDPQEDMGALDLPTQLMAILAGAPAEHVTAALSAIDQRLRRPAMGLTLDALSEGETSPKQVSLWLPILVGILAELGDTEHAWLLTYELLPMLRTDSPERLARYAAEPFVLCAEISASSEHLGRGSGGRGTGCASLLYRVVLEKLLGIEKRGNAVYLHPRVPLDWETYAVTLRFGTSTYHFSGSSDVPFVTLDGEKWNEASLPLADDGRIHEASFPIR